MAQSSHPRSVLALVSNKETILMLHERSVIDSCISQIWFFAWNESNIAQVQLFQCGQTSFPCSYQRQVSSVQLPLYHQTLHLRYLQFRQRHTQPASLGHSHRLAFFLAWQFNNRHNSLPVRCSFIGFLCAVGDKEHRIFHMVGEGIGCHLWWIRCIAVQFFRSGVT